MNLIKNAKIDVTDNNSEEDMSDDDTVSVEVENQAPFNIEYFVKSNLTIVYIGR